MMIDALLRSTLSQVNYPTNVNAMTQDDVDCNLWSGLLEFSVVENGSYAAAVPFVHLGLPYGGAATPDLLVYDGIGGWCGAGTPPASLEFRITVSGVDSLGNPVFGSAMSTQLHPGTDPPHPPPGSYSVEVVVINPVRRKRARLFWIFTVESMC
jgi:hypothetical protein